ncbi:MAG TPA: hypothetical protein VKA84_19880 [Gemmatimonadaceae bacterium]|nr:hypothetical protein [Gemmatimonadaceae bacterium]
MLRTIFTIGLFVILGLFVLNLALGILPALVGLLVWLLGMAIKIALIVLCIYVVVRIFSPDTARRMREKWSGSGT